jgi:transcriptional regulator with XRE-family HTH domain
MMKKLKRFASIGNRLKQLRVPLSQKEFAKRIGVSLPAYQRYEAGERMLKNDALYRIAAVCKMPIEWILTGQIERSYVEDPAALKELIRLDRKKEKTDKDIARIEAIVDKAYRELLERRLFIEGVTMAEIEEINKSLSLPKLSLHKYMEEEINKLKSSFKIITLDKKSILLEMFMQLERIYNEGDKTKIEAVRAQLNVLDPVVRGKTTSIKTSK